MKRRDFITLLGGAAAAWPLAARAQRAPMPVIGILGSESAASYAAQMRVFLQALAESGFVEGQNLALETRWADDRPERLPDMAADLVHRRVALIATLGNNLPARAAQSATTTIPIVFAMGADPVQLGLVASFNKPGGNITGITNLASDLTQKRVQFLRDLAPAAKIFGYLFNADNAGVNSSAGRTNLELTQDAVRAWGGTVEAAPVRTVAEFDAAFSHLASKRVDALTTSGDAIFTSGRERLVALVAQYAIPAMFHTSEIAQAGGLASYGTSTADEYRRAGLYAGRILKGEKPADLPVQAATKFELVINLKTAKAMGLAVSQNILFVADEVIE
jgi:putative ABC transport system substrate-binding protein